MPTQPLTVVAVFRAKAGSEAALERMLAQMIEPTRAEPGCRRYVLHRSLDDARVFFFDETWQTSDDHAEHLKTEHVRRLLRETPAHLDEPIREYRGESLGD